MTQKAAGRRTAVSTNGAAAGYGYSPQYSLMPFTEFEAVGPETPLQSLNLNWRERDLPERVRTKHVHRLHPYLGKFVPAVGRDFPPQVPTHNRL